MIIDDLRSLILFFKTSWIAFCRLPSIPGVLFETIAYSSGRLSSSSGYRKNILNGEVIFTPKINFGVNMINSNRDFNSETNELTVLEKFNFTYDELCSYQVGDYHDDWVQAYAHVTGKK